MDFALEFNLEREQTFKVAKFPSREKKDAYVAAEFKDLKCIAAFQQYCCAITKEKRKEAAGMLDKTRYKFYTNWAHTHLKSFNRLAIVPTDDDIPA